MTFQQAFSGQSVLVTGASSGLGAEFARQLAGANARVGLIARRADLLTQIADDLTRRGAQVAIAQADVGNLAEVQSAVNQIKTGLSIDSFDRVILNAGVGITFKARDFDAEALEVVTRVNYLGAANTIQATLADMIRVGQGHIVGISSLSARRGLPLGFAYGASKAALTTMLEGMRVELKPMGIDVTVIHPGFVRTPMTADQTTPQPGVLNAPDAVSRMLTSIARRKLQFNYPFQTSFLTEVLRRLPAGLSDRLVHRFVLRSIEESERRPITEG